MANDLSPASSPTPEQRFLSYARSGDKAVIQSLIREFASCSYSQARHLIGRHDGAEDAVQEAYLRLVATAHRYDGSISFAAWLGRLVHAAAIDYRRRLQRNKCVGQQGATAMKDSAAQEPAEQPELEALRSALESLPDRYRTPLSLHFLSGLNQQETAEALGVPFETIRKQVARGLERLREKLTRAGVAVTSAALLATFASLPTYAAPPTLVSRLVETRRLAVVQHGMAAKIASSTGIIIAKVAAVALLATFVATLILSDPIREPQQLVMVGSPAHMEISGLVAHWTFDEGSGDIASDASGHAPPGTIHGADWAQGKLGACLDFNGDDDYVEIGNSATLDHIHERDYTLCAWVNADTSPVPVSDPSWHFLNSYAFGIITKNNFDADGGYLHEGLLFDVHGRFSMSHVLSPGTFRTIAWGASDTLPGAWYHLAGVVEYHARTVSIFVNGEMRYKGDDRPPTFSAIDDPHSFGAATWKIGVVLPGAAKRRWPMDGRIDDVRIYDRALTQDEIKSLTNVE